MIVRLRESLALLLVNKQTLVDNLFCAVLHLFELSNEGVYVTIYTAILISLTFISSDECWLFGTNSQRLHMYNVAEWINLWALVCTVLQLKTLLLYINTQHRVGISIGKIANNKTLGSHSMLLCVLCCSYLIVVNMDFVFSLISDPFLTVL